LVILLFQGIAVLAALVPVYFLHLKGRGWAGAVARSHSRCMTRLPTQATADNRGSI
jgi:hypothetical protein